MKDYMKSYKEKLEKGICEYMNSPVSERSATAIHAMFKALRDVESRMDAKYNFSYGDAQEWEKKMENEDGTTGAHWPVEATTSVAMSEGITWDHITPYCWWIAMNMMYSDYCKVAEKFGVDTPEFYACMAKAFLFDKDGPAPRQKLASYYHCIANLGKY